MPKNLDRPECVMSSQEANFVEEVEDSLDTSSPIIVLLNTGF